MLTELLAERRWRQGSEMHCCHKLHILHNPVSEGDYIQIDKVTSLARANLSSALG